MTPLSGTPVRIQSGAYTADIATIGATLRTLHHDGRPLIQEFAADEVRPAYFGAFLAPWPNRVVDGRYSFAGEERQLALTEPDRGHALHGLATWLDFAIADSADDSVRLEATVPAQDGYPHRIALAVEYRLGEAGLECVATAVNDGPDAAPFGTSAHPYLVAGDGPVDDWTLTVPADQVMQVDDRLSPEAATEVSGELDFRGGRRIADAQVDHAYTALERDESGIAELRLTVADGSGVAMRWGREYPWLQIFTGDLPVERLARLGVAAEPMTCPPDAFNSGTDLIVLEPGESFTGSWTISAI